MLNRGNNILENALLLLLPGAAALGAHASFGRMAGFEASGIVILVLLGLVYKTLFTGIKKKGITGPLRGYYLLLGIFWILWSLLATLMWAPDKVAAFRCIIILLFGFAIAFIIFQLTLKPKYIDYLLAGWIFGFIIVSLIAFWEITTGQHLPGYFSDHVLWNPNKIWASATFDNPNNFAAFLLLTYPILLIRINKGNLKKRIIFLLLIAILLTLLFYAQGRMAFFGFIAVTVAYYSNQIKKNKLYILYLIVIVTVALIAIRTTDIMDTPLIVKTSRLQHEGAQEGSIRARLGLGLSALWMVYNTTGLGVGPGGYSHALVQDDNPITFYSTVNPHGFIFEIMAEYGVFVLLGFLILFYRLITGRQEVREKRKSKGRFQLNRLIQRKQEIREKKNIKNKRKSRELSKLDRLIRRKQGIREKKNIKKIYNKHDKQLYLFILAYAFASFENSSFIAVYYNWVYLALMVTYCASSRMDEKHSYIVFNKK